MRRSYRVLILVFLLAQLIYGCNRIATQNISEPENTKSATTVSILVTKTQKPGSIPALMETTESTEITIPSASEPMVSTPTSISRATPTFDEIWLQTTTPVEPVKCPPVDNSLKLVIKPENQAGFLDWNGWKVFEETILDYLNGGGSYENMVLEYTSGNVHLGNDEAYLPVLQKDMTNDGLPEILVINPAYYDQDVLTGGSAIYIFGCDQGKVETLFVLDLGVYANWHAVQFMDLNTNGTPDMIIQSNVDNSMEQGTRVIIHEWEDNQFASLLSIPYFPNQALYYQVGQADFSGLLYKDWLLATELIQPDFQDINQDGFFELLINIQDYLYSNEPHRTLTNIYAWNGQQFTFYQTLAP